MCFYCPPDGVTYFGAGFVKKFGGQRKEVAHPTNWRDCDFNSFQANLVRKNFGVQSSPGTNVNSQYRSMIINA